MQGGTPGRADYYAPGDWNATCSLCGRKRKMSQLEKNWQGYYRCPEHNEPRQYQDFVRSIPDKMGVPYTLELSRIYVELTPSFPVSVSPSSLVLTQNPSYLETESGVALETESGIEIATENVSYLGGPATVLIPSWVTTAEAPPWGGKGTDLSPSAVVTYAWSLISGSGISASSPTAPATYFSATNPNSSGVMQCLITLPNGSTATVTVSITVQASVGSGMTLPWLHFALNL
jgi:hypothetical protein